MRTRNLLMVLPMVSLGACTTPSPEPQPIGMANPASTHCIALGGSSVLRETPAGQVRDCHLPDGRVVEEWELFRSRQAD